ncbi:MAG: hypothetical protein RTU30_09755 [Candidatus Thorarchaeota archaeon]
MSKRKRTSVEDAVARVLSYVKKDAPVTVGHIAGETDLSWAVVNRAVELVMGLQDFLTAKQVEVLGGRGRKVILLGLRLDKTRLPAEVRDWFIDEYFFKGEEKRHLTTKKARETILSSSNQQGRTTFEVSIDRCITALELEDELSVLELSKRTDLNRRTIERVLDFILRFQSDLSKSVFMMIDGNVVRRKAPDLYGLDNTSMLYLLKKRYLPHLAESLSDEQERTLLHLA